MSAALSVNDGLVEFTRESWRTAWPEARLLAEQHQAELGQPPLMLDERLLEAASDCGAFHIYGARVAGELVAYICWSIGKHPEQKGRVMAKMGPWFALPDCRAGTDLFLFSLDEMQALGVNVAYPHHRWNTRGGQRLEQFFVSLGARALHVEYELPLTLKEQS